jgi:hypothetical protein
MEQRDVPSTMQVGGLDKVLPINTIPKNSFYVNHPAQAPGFQSELVITLVISPRELEREEEE